MSKIITVTVNTAIDRLIEAEGLAEHDTILAKKSSEFACGKAIHVAKAVAALGYPITCLGFAGLQSMGLFDALRSALLRQDLIAGEGKIFPGVCRGAPREGYRTRGAGGVNAGSSAPQMRQ